MIESVASLIRSSQPGGSLEDLRSRAAVLEDMLAERLKENARAQADLETFRIRLIADNVRRLRRDIVAARNRRDAMLWNR